MKSSVRSVRRAPAGHSVPARAISRMAKAHLLGRFQECAGPFWVFLGYFYTLVARLLVSRPSPTGGSGPVDCRAKEYAYSRAAGTCAQGPGASRHARRGEHLGRVETRRKAAAIRPRPSGSFVLYVCCVLYIYYKAHH